MKKHYVLDTNILIHDPDAIFKIFKFEDNYVDVKILLRPITGVCNIIYTSNLRRSLCCQKS